jgi:chaperonin GroES
MEGYKMKIKPFHDNVFVERDEPEEKKSPGGIVLPLNTKEVPDTAVVLAVGPGRVMSDGTLVIPDVKVGDRIFIGRYSGTEINFGREKRVVIPWSDILGIVEDEDDIVEDDIVEDKK